MTLSIGRRPRAPKAFESDYDGGFRKKTPMLKLIHKTGPDGAGLTQETPRKMPRGKLSTVQKGCTKRGRVCLKLTQGPRDQKGPDLGVPE